VRKRRHSICFRGSFVSAARDPLRHDNEIDPPDKIDESWAMASLSRTLLIPLSCLFLLFFAAGCPCGRMNRHLPGEKCEQDGDCEDHRCDPIRKVCVQACKNDGDCIQGGHCRAGFCEASPPSSSPSTS